MFTHILVPLDGSQLAERALPIAARIARASSARILLVQAVAVPVAYGLTFEGEALQWHLVEDLSKAAQTYLDEIARSEQLAGVPVERVVRVGTAADVILDVAAERGVDLVALTSHGRTGIGRWVLGSVANRVAQNSAAPVLILYARGDEGGAEANPERLAHILVPLDGSPLAEAALAPARALALALGESGEAALHLALVVTPSEAGPANMPQALIVDGAEAYLERVAQRLRAENTAGESLAVTWSVVVNRDVAQGIFSTAESGEGGNGGTPAAARGNLIAMATHGRGGITRWALGSVTDRVLHAAKLPLLIVRPAETATQSKG